MYNFNIYWKESAVGPEIDALSIFPLDPCFLLLKESNIPDFFLDLLSNFGDESNYFLVIDYKTLGE